MKAVFRTLAVSAALIMSAPSFAADHGTKEEATAMVKKATAFLKANGKDKTLAEISNNKGQFVDRDLYISVYDLNGMVLAHGTNAKLIGKDVSALKDADGKEFIKDIVGKAKAAGKLFAYLAEVRDREGFDRERLERMVVIGANRVLLPLGGPEGHKGYGLSVMVEILSALLPGLGFGVEPTGRHNDGCFLAVFNTAAFRDLATFKREVAEFAGQDASVKSLEHMVIEHQHEERRDPDRRGDRAERCHMRLVGAFSLSLVGRG